MRHVDVVGSCAPTIGMTWTDTMLQIHWFLQTFLWSQYKRSRVRCQREPWASCWGAQSKQTWIQNCVLEGRRIDKKILLFFCNFVFPLCHGMACNVLSCYIMSYHVKWRDVYHDDVDDDVEDDADDDDRDMLMMMLMWMLLLMMNGNRACQAT